MDQSTVEVDIEYQAHDIHSNDDNGKYTYTYYEGGAAITVTEYIEPKDFPGYKVCIHKPPNGYTISKIKGAPGNGLPNQVYCSTVSVIYWLGDSNHDKPLAVQLGHNGEYYTTTKEDRKWSKSGYKTPDHILKELDNWVCKNREAHIINFSEKGSQLGQNYSCSGCSGKQIKVTETTYQGCTLYIHEVIKGSVSRFKDSKTNYSGLSNIKEVKSVNAYCKNDSDIFLIYFKPENGHSGVSFENRWYSRCSGDTHWEEENALKGEQPGNNIAKIKGILDDSLTPRVVIDLSIIKETYSPRNNTLQFEVINTEVRGSSFFKCTHKWSGGRPFRLKDVECGGKLLGIKSDGLLSCVCAYYHSGHPTVPLLIELEFDTPKKYEHYKKSLIRQGQWVKFFGHHTTNITEGDLVKSLKALKRIGFPGPPSKTDIIETSLIVTDVLAGGGSLGYGGYKLWLTLAARL
ncbi:hypothetical protein BEWA_016170 [Theileria equi strain WA]|uniref:Uncharacterized protein n=1 Tax=Theileria equi strain WA TaxID=1537102 RepID=L1LCI7_THEEQ|nr:hypothetical protein BEWA_016170 [Theileria equi strain WA]EKX73056.1 hypothetical protein BEWA_016170 [Theileria equi strain WA]|eukprot:XP_004832508.1 hypothetical protein BEWA_016170 [Theileria equi strain WA]